jgi:predicted AAA+ superfamily ATPase
MRRAGKTTFLLQLLDARRAEVARERALYLSFDDDRLAGIGVEQLGYLLEEYYRAHPTLRGRVTAYWFLDEIQFVPEWERFARRLLDTERIELVVSGSSASTCAIGTKNRPGRRGAGRRPSALSWNAASASSSSREDSRRHRGLRRSSGSNCCRATWTRSCSAT